MGTGKGMFLGLFLAVLFAVMGSPVVAQVAGGELIEIPLRVEGGWLLIPVEGPGGAEFEFALSTGNPTILSESTAARLGDHTGLVMGGVPVQMEGSQTLPDAELTLDGTVLDGMIGPTTLNQFDILVDVPHGRLLLKPVGPRVTWAGMTMSEPIRVRVLHGILLGLDVEFEGREYAGMIDLGVSTLVVNAPVERETRIDAEDRVTLSLGGTVFSDLPVRVLDLPLFQGWDPTGEGFVVVGATVAEQCALSISWVHREIRTCVR